MRWSHGGAITNQKYKTVGSQAAWTDTAAPHTPPRVRLWETSAALFDWLEILRSVEANIISDKYVSGVVQLPEVFEMSHQEKKERRELIKS